MNALAGGEYKQRLRAVDSITGGCLLRAWLQKCAFRQRFAARAAQYGENRTDRDIHIDIGGTVERVAQRARSEEHTSELQSPDQHSFPTRRSSDLSVSGSPRGQRSTEKIVPIETFTSILEEPSSGSHSARYARCAPPSGMR